MGQKFFQAQCMVDAYEVEIEVHAGYGDPKVIIVGLPDAAVKESSERVWTALTNSGFDPPLVRTTVNLAPADIKKEGPSFDLPIALGMLAAGDQMDGSPFGDYCVTGELALSGEVRRVRVCCPSLSGARRAQSVCRGYGGSRRGQGWPFIRGQF